MSDIDARPFKDVDLHGATVVVAIPSVGLASTIAGTYMITTLKMDQVVAFDSDDFPPLSMVYAHKPKFPVRVYASPKDKLAVFISEVPLPPRIHRALGRKLLDWAKTKGAARIIVLEGLPLPEEHPGDEIDVWGVGSVDASNAEIEAAKIRLLETGMVAGVAGVLLNEGRWEKFGVIALLGEARDVVPDAQAAARLVEAVDRLLPSVEIDLSPLLDQAKDLERHLQGLKEQAKPVTKEAPETFYR